MVTKKLGNTDMTVGAIGQGSAYPRDKMRQNASEIIYAMSRGIDYGMNLIDSAEILSRRGVEVEIIDPRSASPFNDEIILESVNKTRRCIIADNDWLHCGFSAEIATRVYEKCFGKLSSPIARIGFAHTPYPTARILENEFYPNAVKIVRIIEKELGLSPADLSQENFYSHENRFKGPF